MSLLLHINFFISFIILIYLWRRFGFINPIVIPYFIFFIYGQSFYLDSLIIGMDNLVGFITVHINSKEYKIVSSLYTLFAVFYLIPILFYRKGPSNRYKLQDYYFINNKYLTWIIISIFSIAILYMAIKLGFSNRFEKVQIQSQNKQFVFLVSFTGFGLIFMAIKTAFSRNKAWLPLLVFICVITINALTEGGREFFVYFALSYLFFQRKFHLSWIQYLLGSILFSILVVWKAFSSLFLEKGDFALFVNVTKEFPFTLSGIDPTSSILIISSYYTGDHIGFFSQYYYSYIFNNLGQFFRTFGIVEYESIGKAITKYFNSDHGLAFSGIMESVLNFGFFGPVFLGVFLGLVSILIYSKHNNDPIFYSILSVCFIVVIMKLVRTELAVVLKIYILPMIISYFIFYRALFKKKYAISF